MLPESKFVECYRFNDWISLPVPDLNLRMNAYIVDRHLKESTESKRGDQGV